MKQTATQVRGNATPVTQSGVYDFRDQDLGTAITECPQAGNTNPNKPLDKRQKDSVEQISSKGDDRRSNADYSCFPQDEVSVDTNPRNSNNFFVGANDYRLGTGSSGFHSTTNGGKTFYDGIIPFPSAPAPLSRGEGFVISGGDPVANYDRAGIAYYTQIAFFRGDDTNGVFVSRSTNGAFTWSRACVPNPTADPTDPPDNSVCGGVGDPRQPGDGRVTYNPDNDNTVNGSQPFDDKEYMTSGPRPAGVTPVCFSPVTRTPGTCVADAVGIDRLYVTFTRFTANASQIYISYSDDRAHSWSPPRVINGSANFCSFSALSANGCDDNQASIPTVNPATGHLWVAFENFNTADENQYVVVRSNDGGNTFTGPFFVTPVFDLNFPRAGVQRPDCTARGQQSGRIVYTNSCFRSNSYGNIVADKRGGAFADDLYLVMSDNRNGTVYSSNADIFYFKSTDGGMTWIGPTRVNNDSSTTPTGSFSPGTGTGRDCLRPAGSIGFANVPPSIYAVCEGNFGNDQWWPWVDIGKNGELNFAFKDRRLDKDSVKHEWPTSRQRPGNYLVWTWGAQCEVDSTATVGPTSTSIPSAARDCVAPGAQIITQPTGGVNPGPDPVPGQGNTYVGPLKNIQVSDVPSNFDYSFRAGIFAGDYEAIAVSDGKMDDSNKDDDHGDDDEGDNGHGLFAVNVFTDARNGRSSRNQPGRNPICEQSDIFFDIYPALGAKSTSVTTNYDPFLVTPCPAAARDDKDDSHTGDGHDDDDKDKH